MFKSKEFRYGACAGMLVGAGLILSSGHVLGLTACLALIVILIPVLD